MSKKILFSIVFIIIILMIVIFVVIFNRVPEYPVKVSYYESFLAGISQVIKLGPAKRTEVSISDQKLKMFEGNKLVKELTISTGALETPTPTGTFKIYNKFLMVNSKKLGCWLP
ncbi:MAG: L,D-transpeptidase, partial [Candidatus Staskawiczbacteria bacterium]|nr:L,D-transpeptidase [Candidatus Staskawiczbacteria bacterium]